MLAALAACSSRETSPGAAMMPDPTAGGGGNSTLVVNLDDLQAETDEEEDEPRAPTLSPEALALVATWCEPHRDRSDGVETWTWQGSDETWELRLTGSPFISEDDRRVLGSNRTHELRLVRSGPQGETVLRASDLGDQHVQLAGSVDGRAADADEVRQLLSELLPAVVAHTGLAADHRIEMAVQQHGVREALEQVAALTSSSARLAGYETLFRELDEPKPADVARVLRHAAGYLPDDHAMHELLLEVADISFDQRSLVAPILEAAATIEDDEVQCDVLTSLLDRSDEPSDATVARVLRLAISGVESDAPLAALLEEGAFQALGGKASRLAWVDALATIKDDGPLATAIASAFCLDDPQTETCLAAVQAVRRITSEPLRAEVLCSANLDDLADANVTAACAEVVAGLQDAGVRATLLVSLVRRERAAADWTSRWLMAAHDLPPDERLASVLRAVPEEQLTHPDVATPYRTLARSLASEADQAQVLARLPAAAPP